jgi:hypothetical protein
VSEAAERIRRFLAWIVGWIAFAVLGWFAYALLKALVEIIYLDVPFYDWQWYVPAIGFFVGVPFYLTWRMLRRRSLFGRGALLFFTVLLLWVVLGYNGFGHVEVLYPQHAAKIPLSFWAYYDLRDMPESLIDDVRDAGGRLYLGFGPDNFVDGGAAFTAAMRRAVEKDLEVIVTAPAHNFTSVPVSDEWTTNALHLADLIKREGLSSVTGFIGDVEQPVAWPLDVLGRDRAEFDRAVEAYRRLMSTLRRDYSGLRIGVTALWSHFADTVDGDADLAIVLRSPLDPPDNWDFVNLMTYSSYLPEGERPYYVYVHERAMARLYPPERVSHLLGLVGEAMPQEPLMDFDELVRDALISRALGVREIAVFQLNGAVKVMGDNFVRHLNAAVNGASVAGEVSVPFSRPVSLKFYGPLAADAVLDGLQSRSALLAIWIAISGWLALYVTQPRLKSSP